jgi:DNA-binding transcriptional LysR family regulator
MDRFDAMRVFMAVADEGGFAAAARRLSLSPPAVTRAIASLEERLGTRLLHRTTRIVRLTEAGTRFLVDCRRILAEVEEAEASATGAHRDPRGQLAVTAPILFGRRYVSQIVLDFLDRYPQVSVRTMLADRIVDIVDEGFDVAVRIAHLPDSSLSAVRVGSVRRVVCAAPGYLAARGMPRTPADLAHHEAVVFSSAASVDDWVFDTATGTHGVRPPGRLIVNTAEVAVAAAVAGRGLTRVLSYQIADELRDGRLKIVLADLEPAPLPIHLVHREGRRTTAKVRAFVDFAVARLRADTSLN